MSSSRFRPIIVNIVKSEKLENFADFRKPKLTAKLNTSKICRNYKDFFWKSAICLPEKIYDFRVIILLLNLYITRIHYFLLILIIGAHMTQNLELLWRGKGLWEIGIYLHSKFRGLPLS